MFSSETFNSDNDVVIESFLFRPLVTTLLQIKPMHYDIDYPNRGW